MPTLDLYMLKHGHKHPYVHVYTFMYHIHIITQNNCELKIRASGVIKVYEIAILGYGTRWRLNPESQACWQALFSTSELK